MTIRKIITALILFCLCFSLCSCSSINNEETEAINETVVESQEITNNPLPVKEEIKSDELIESDEIVDVIEPPISKSIEEEIIPIKEETEVKDSNTNVEIISSVNQLNEMIEELPIKSQAKEKPVQPIIEEINDTVFSENNINDIENNKEDLTSINEVPDVELIESEEVTIATPINNSINEEVITSIEAENNLTNNDEEIIQVREYMNYILYISLIILVIMIFRLRSKNNDLLDKYLNERRKNQRLQIDTIEESKAQIKTLDEEHQKLCGLINQNTHSLEVLKSSNSKYEEKNRKLDVQIINKKKKLNRINEVYRSIDYSLNTYNNSYDLNSHVIERIDNEDINDANTFAPTVIINLQHMNYKDLRKEFNKYNKLVDELLEKYKKRYTTKANKTIYKLMTIALRAELQNILYNLKYEKLDVAIDQVKVITSKYLVIASDGNKSIEKTLIRFIGELEYLFICLIKVEYEYYIKREQARQEQLAIRQKMREEAEEKRRLAEEAKKIKEEESKYLAEIEKLLEQQKEETDSSKLEDIANRMAEINESLDSIKDKEEEILKLQNGKAGNVYVISNLGSFGENTFKIGMTRRLDPQDRVNELGSASVPFKFDVHSFIFSDDAVSLESELHKRLNENRVNKVNKRKEFFNVAIDELENIVLDINPAAEFNKTMIAEEYRQTLSKKIS